MTLYFFRKGSHKALFMKVKEFLKKHKTSILVGSALILGAGIGVAAVTLFHIKNKSIVASGINPLLLKEMKAKDVVVTALTPTTPGEFAINAFHDGEETGYAIDPFAILAFEHIKK